MLVGEPVAIAGFIDHGGPGPLDEVLVERANGEERTVRRDEITSLFDVIQGHWQTREVHLAAGRLTPPESLAIVRHLPNSFGWGYGGSGPAQLALAIRLRATDREPAVAPFSDEIARCHVSTLVTSLLVPRGRPIGVSFPGSLRIWTDRVYGRPAKSVLMGPNIPV